MTSLEPVCGVNRYSWGRVPLRFKTVLVVLVVSAQLGVSPFPLSAESLESEVSKPQVNAPLNGILEEVLLYEIIENLGTPAAQVKARVRSAFEEVRQRPGVVRNERLQQRLSLLESRALARIDYLVDKTERRYERAEEAGTLEPSSSTVSSVMEAANTGPDEFHLSHFLRLLKSREVRLLFVVYVMMVILLVLSRKRRRPQELIARQQ